MIKHDATLLVTSPPTIWRNLDDFFADFKHVHGACQGSDEGA